MNSLKYLIDRDIDDELDRLILIELKKYNLAIGKKCKVCGIVQGSPKKGWRRYFCKHLEDNLHKEMKEEKEKITKKIFLFTSVCQDNSEVS